MEFLLILMLTVSSYVDSTATNNCISAVQSTEDTEELQPWKMPYLPKTIEPVRYDLHLFPDFYYNSSVLSGHIDIHIKVINDTNTILVHTRNLNITQTKLKPCFQEPWVNVTSAFKYNEYWVVKTNQTMQASECTITLFLQFNGKLTVPSEGTSRSDFGFYKTTYVNDITQKESWLVATDFQPSNSRMAFPSFDEPQFKAPFYITLLHWRNFTALSNAEEEGTSDFGQIWRYTRFKLSPIMSSYLVNFIISDFNFKANRLVTRKLNRVWARPDRLDKVDYALNITPVVENYFHQETDLAYPLEKLDHFALPGLTPYSGMESWGLIAYAESRFLGDVKKDGAIAKLRALSLIAHELAHNYFGNLVTCRFWNHLWLNEGFASFYVIGAVTAVDPTFFYKEQYFAERLEFIMDLDAANKTTPLVPVLSSPDEAGKLFDSTRHLRGAATIGMVESFMGPAFYSRGIKRYLRDNQYKTVETSHLWAALQQDFIDTGLNLDEIMKTWIYKEGIPVISVLPLLDNQFVAIQERFLIDPLAVDDCRYIWHVPLNYRTKGGNNGLVWVKRTYFIFSISLNSNDDWIQFNHDASGYYRVNYHPILWERIAKQLNDDYKVFTEIARWKLLSDAASLAKAEQISYDRYLGLARYASKERGVAPWICIISNIGVIDSMIAATANFSRFQRYVLNLTTSMMNELQVEDDDRFVNKRLRPQIIRLSCSAGHRGCISNTTRIFKAWLENQTRNAIPESFGREVYCIGVANSVLESEWNIVYERYMTTTVDKERSALLNALTCSRNVTILKRLLEYAINETKMASRDSSVVINGIASNPASEGCVLKWLKLNDTGIEKAARERHSETMIEATSNTVRTREQRQEVLDFLNNYPFVERSRIPQFLDIMDKKIRWMDKNFPSIDNWLEQNVP